MKKSTAIIILLYLTVTVCRAQEFIVTDSTAFRCLYKISFLGRTVDYVEQISYLSTHHIWSKDSGSVVIDTTFRSSFLNGDMGRFVGDSMSDMTATEVLVQSCDGKKKYEIDYTMLQYFIVNDGSVTPISFMSEGAFIDLKKSFEVHNEFEKITIALKEVPNPLYLSILIGIDPKK